MRTIWKNKAHFRLSALGLPFRVVLPNGETFNSEINASSAPKLTLHQWSALVNLLSGRIGVLASDMVEGRINFEGSMRELIQIAQQFLISEPGEISRNVIQRVVRGSANKWQSYKRHSISQDAKNIQSHYDVSDDFYALWLDPKRIYSCAYFSQPNMTLTQAQEEKLDLVCRKLHLKQGDRFLDVGAGWGGLLFWAAEHYGVEAIGITVSRNQYRHINSLIQARGMQKKVTIQFIDYRDLGEQESFDKIASIGMFEHVGRANIDAYFAKLYQLLNPGGLLLNHGITAGGVGYTELGLGLSDFIEKYIFPGGELLHISEITSRMSQSNLEIVDIENLRPHYAKTLWAWSDNLEARLDEAQKVLSHHGKEYANRILQAYRLYLAGCALGFERGWTSIHQILAVRAGPVSDYPFHRNYMYRVAPESQQDP